jgi:hypothetical protein
MEIRLKGFSAYLDLLTNNTCILVISDTALQTAAIQLNVKAARRQFERIELS